MKNDRNIKLQFIRKVKAGCDSKVTILDTEKELPALFLNMGKIVEGFVSSVGNDQSIG